MKMKHRGWLCWKFMSVSELEKEKTKILKEVNSSKRLKKTVKRNKNSIVFKF